MGDGRKETDVDKKREEDGVRSARWRVERMEVDSDNEKASGSRTIETMVSRAKEGWQKVKQILDGKRLVREKGSGKVMVKAKTGVSDNEERTVMEEWEESITGGEVVVEVEVVGKKDNVSVASEETKGTAIGFDFLEGMGEEKTDEELDKKRAEGRKRKREHEERTQKEEGLYRVPGWEWREDEARKDERWKREVLRRKEGSVSGERVKEKIPLPENFCLGKDVRGVDLNHSGKVKNNFGQTRRLSFRGGGTKRWMEGIGLQLSQNRGAWPARMTMGVSLTREESQLR